MSKYTVAYHQTAVRTVYEVFDTIKEARQEASDYIEFIRETCTNAKGFKKIGNIKHNALVLKHAAFGIEASVIITKTGI